MPISSHYTSSVASCVCVVRARGSWNIILRLWDSCWQSRFTVFSPFGFNSSFQADRYSIPSPPPQLHLLWYSAGLKTRAVKKKTLWNAIHLKNELWLLRSGAILVVISGKQRWRREGRKGAWFNRPPTTNWGKWFILCWWMAVRVKQWFRPVVGALIRRFKPRADVWNPPTCSVCYLLLCYISNILYCLHLHQCVWAPEFFFCDI